MKTVCIIGGGAAGLNALKHVLENPYLEGTIFERAERIGGVWRYSSEHETLKPSEQSFPTPVYPNLRMNLPRILNYYLDFPWPESNDKDICSFPKREEVIDYLKTYADKFSLHDHIKLQHEIIEVKPIDPNNRENPKWQVKVKSLQSNSGKITSYEFDYVIVCTGREMEHHLPKIPNAGDFKGSIITAAEYAQTIPETFRGKRVVLLGLGPSGMDIGLMVLPFAKEVIISCKQLPKILSHIVPGFPTGMRSVPAWKSFTANGLILIDGTELSEVDAVIVCTGYEYNHSFLVPECGIVMENGRRLSYVYRHVVNVKYPTMCFVGLTSYGPAFYMQSCLSKWVVKIFDGTVQLPSESEMMTDIQKARDAIVAMELDEFNYAHHILFQQWKLYKDMAAEGEFEIIPYAEKVMTELIPKLFTDPANFRKDIYRKVDEETVEIEISGGKL